MANHHALYLPQPVQDFQRWLFSWKNPLNMVVVMVIE
jgi:hypothetical protein